MKSTIITEYDPAKVARAEAELDNMRKAKVIGEWYKTRKITKIVWNFKSESDARDIASIFMNRMGFESVSRP